MWWWRTTDEPYLLVVCDTMYEYKRGKYFAVASVDEFKWILDYSAFAAVGHWLPEEIVMYEAKERRQ